MHSPNIPPIVPQLRQAEQAVLDALSSAKGRGKDGLSEEQLDQLNAAVAMLEADGGVIGELSSGARAARSPDRPRLLPSPEPSPPRSAAPRSADHLAAAGRQLAAAVHQPARQRVAHPAHLRGCAPGPCTAQLPAPWRLPARPPLGWRALARPDPTRPDAPRRAVAGVDAFSVYQEVTLQGEQARVNNIVDFGSKIGYLKVADGLVAGADDDVLMCWWLVGWGHGCSPPLARAAEPRVLVAQPLTCRARLPPAGRG
jgi:hypothetical protein